MTPSPLLSLLGVLQILSNCWSPGFNGVPFKNPPSTRPQLAFLVESLVCGIHKSQHQTNLQSCSHLPSTQLSRMCGNHITSPPAQPSSTPQAPSWSPLPITSAPRAQCLHLETSPGPRVPPPRPELFKLSSPQLFSVPGLALSAEIPMKAVA